MIKAAREIRSFKSWIQCTKNGIIGSWEAHLPSGLSPLMSL